jgi:hypothetical protein
LFLEDEDGLAMLILNEAACPGGHSKILEEVLVLRSGKRAKPLENVNLHRSFVLCKQNVIFFPW